MTMAMRAEALSLLLALFALSACALPGVAAEASSRKLLSTQCLGWASSYGQCGGTECPNGSDQCSDSAYLCCPSDFSCQRLNAKFWSCYPEGSAVASPTTAPYPAPSGAPALAPAYGLPAVSSRSASGYAPASPSPPAYGLSPSSRSPTPYGYSPLSPTAPAPTSVPRQTPAAEYAPPAEEDSPPSQWWSDDCEVVDNNADYPDGLQCSGDLPDPSCCSGDTCYTYSFWDASKPHLAFASAQPNAGLGSCTGDYLIACCPAPVPE